MIERIMIDPGHGGDDNGAVWGYAEEDDINLNIAYLLRCELEKSYYIVELTREKDIYVRLSKRIKLAEDMSADLFLSIHCDAFHNETASGMSVHIYQTANNATRLLAKRINEAMAIAFPLHKNRGVRESNFYVLREAGRMSSVLIECEFISNPDTRKFLKEPENQLALARAIMDGIPKWGDV